jgi:hypothetical protein
MLANVTRLLDRKRFVIREVPWSASYGPVPAALGSSYDQSLNTGRTMLLKAIKDDPNPVALLGYSGGAALAGNVASEISWGRHTGLDVRGVGLISDPRRHPGLTDPTWGIAGARMILPRFPVWSLADPADVITSCPGNSPLRTLADQSAAFSLADPVAWGADLVGRLKTNQWQAVRLDWRNPRAVLAQYRQAIVDAEGYLTGDHTGYSRRIYRDGRTYTQWLADRINEL